MRRRIAVFANGWGYEYLCEIVTGLCDVAKKEDIDVFTFISFATGSGWESKPNAETNIFRLVQPEDFDGAVILANSFNLEEEMNCVYEAVMRAKLPAVSVEYDLDGICSIGSDNYSGMYDLAKHVVEEHGAKKIVYIGGPKEHLESNLRLKAVRDVLRENGLTLPDENIIYGDWAKTTCVDEFAIWCGRAKGLPDAVICANDIMAMGICDYVKDIGRSIPEDVIVTGYDCLTMGQEYEPPISSVSHEWGSMSRRAMQLLIELMDGKKPRAGEVTKTKFVSGGSCGCVKQDDDKIDLADILRKRNHSKVERMALDSHFRHIYLSIRKIEDAKGMYNSFNRLFGIDHLVEGDGFTLCLEREFFNIMPEDENLRTSGYNENMDVVCSLKEGVPREHRVMSYREAIFGAIGEKPQPGHYIFVTFAAENKTFGFAMLNRNIDIVLDYDLYSWTRHMNQYLEQVRRNFTIADLTRKLTKMSVTDVLTGVYNRAGCEQVAYPQLQKWVNEGETGVLMIADVDKMKVINDRYGHSSGDLALRTVASVIKSSVPDEWIVARFGGDEFMVGGKLENVEDVQKFLDEIDIRLQGEMKHREIPFELTVSIGCEMLEPGDYVIDFEKSFQHADEKMYAMKDAHHAARES